MNNPAIPKRSKSVATNYASHRCDNLQFYFNDNLPGISNNRIERAIYPNLLRHKNYLFNESLTETGFETLFCSLFKI